MLNTLGLPGLVGMEGRDLAKWLQEKERQVAGSFSPGSQVLPLLPGVWGGRMCGVTQSYHCRCSIGKSCSLTDNIQRMNFSPRTTTTLAPSPQTGKARWHWVAPANVTQPPISWHERLDHGMRGDFSDHFLELEILQSYSCLTQNQTDF